MFERFTDDARRVVVVAQEEAHELGRDHVDVVHLLLGLLRVDGVAREALERCGVEFAAARAGLGTGGSVGQREMPFSGRAKQALELALREATFFRDPQIDTEHLLLGLLRTGDGTVEVLLEHFGTDADHVFGETIAVRAATRSPGAPRVDRWSEAARAEEPLVYVDERRSLGQSGVRAWAYRSLHSTVPFRMMWPPYRRSRSNPQDPDATE